MSFDNLLCLVFTTFFLCFITALLRGQFKIQVVRGRRGFRPAFDQWAEANPQGTGPATQHVPPTPRRGRGRNQSGRAAYNNNCAFMRNYGLPSYAASTNVLDSRNLN